MDWTKLKNILGSKSASLAAKKKALAMWKLGKKKLEEQAKRALKSLNMSKDELQQLRAAAALPLAASLGASFSGDQAQQRAGFLSRVGRLAGGRAASVAEQFSESPRQAMGIPRFLQPFTDPQSMVQMADQLDQITTSMKLATRGAGDLTGMLAKLADSTIDVGISNSDSSAAIQALFRSNLAFTEYINQKSKKELIEFTAILAKFGVGAGLTAGLTNTLSKRMGMGAGQTKDFLDELTKTAKRIGVSLPTAMQDFNSGVDRLMLTGIDKLTSRFSKLQGLVKATGISYSDMMSTFGTSTDTFSGSVKISSQLNAVLGTNISAMKLLRNDAEQNVALISKALRSSGKTFDQLGKFEKLMLMQATGIRSASQLKSLMDKSPVELELAQLKGQMGNVRGLREDRKTMVTRQDLESGMGERLLFKSLNNMSQMLKGRFSILARDLKAAPDRARYRIYEAQVARGMIVLGQSFKIQREIFTKTLPENMSKPLDKFLKKLNDLSNEFVEALAGPKFKEIMKGRGNTNVGGQR